MKSARYEIGSFLFDSERGDLFSGQEKVALTGKELQILFALVESGTRYISNEELKAKVWKSVNVLDHTVSVHTSNLNVKLNRLIEGLPGTGYRLRQLTKRVEHNYLFDDIWEGAGKVAEHVFGSFKANAVLTFAGHSAIFANLVMASHANRKEMLNMPLYLALQRYWRTSDPKKKLPTVPLYTPVVGDGVVVLVPDALTELEKGTHKPLRLAVIDDVIISAEVMACLRPFLQKVLGDSARIEFVCFICFEQVSKVMKNRKPEFAHISSETERFTLPWGQPLWFGNQ